jgi:hypothetical protein
MSLHLAVIYYMRLIEAAQLQINTNFIYGTFRKYDTCLIYLPPRSAVSRMVRPSTVRGVLSCPCTPLAVSCSCTGLAGYYASPGRKKVLFAK